MLNESQIEDLISSLLSRPEMYASNPESLMAQVLTAYYIKTGQSLWRELFVYGQEYFDLEPNAAPFHLRLDLTVQDMKTLLVTYLGSKHIYV